MDQRSEWSQKEVTGAQGRYRRRGVQVGSWITLHRETIWVFTFHTEKYHFLFHEDIFCEQKRSKFVVTCRQFHEESA